MFANYLWVQSVHLEFYGIIKANKNFADNILLNCKLLTCAFVYHIQGQAVTQYLPSTPQKNLSLNPIQF